MIIYKCVITGDEMFSDIYKIKEIANGILFEVEGKVISRKLGEVDDSLIGGNASAEEASESLETATESGVDIIMNHKLQETSYDKKAYMSYIKEYMKAVTKEMTQTNPDRVEQFKKDVQPAVKMILERIKDFQFFSGESMNPEGTLGLLDYREDGITPYMLFFKDGLLIEKC
ncbi:translationally-controlled tumor protein homolog [Sphaeramia orbicularis]|uniref:Translationally-controlled tumor protein homolog n=1 Tax=Sphaeramia orbicularis TaxID=375764 RepID=A0A673AUQ0_9TELE|nr:translationally-controlled tumor protein [Sphaeramia orbicularis]